MQNLDLQPSNEVTIIDRPNAPTRTSAVDRPSAFGYSELLDPRDCQSIGFRKAMLHQPSLPVPSSHVRAGRRSRVTFPSQPGTNLTPHVPLPLTRIHGQAGAQLPQGRSTGQLLIGLMFCLSVFLIAYVIWNGFFRFQGYGFVSGRVLQVAPEWEGIITGIQVRDGEIVQQGQPLFTVVNDEFEQEMQAIDVELRTATASLDAEIYEIRWQSETKADSRQFATSEYHKRLAELEAERSEHERLKAELKRMRSLKEKNPRAVRVADLEALEIETAGKQKRVDALGESVSSLEPDANMDPSRRAWYSFKSKRAAIDGLTLKLERLRDRLAKGIVRAPVAGRIVRKRRFTGEFVGKGESVLDILEDGSLKVSVYLPPNKARQLAVGEDLNLEIFATGTKADCEVIRLAEQLGTPPESIQRYYRDDELLLAVDAEMPLALRLEEELPLGSLVRVPTTLSLTGKPLRKVSK